MITVYDEKNNIPNWVVYSDRAILAKEHILYLYGHVEFNSLTQNLQLDCIKTNKAKLNLVNQDIESNDQVTLHGPNFNATGINMHGNLRKKNTLLEKVKISYDIQNEKKKPSLVTYSCPFGY
ncbi:hypothetical protein HHS_03540 [Candidatus Pantoea carbekii]|uniref:Organic solvent tolerance-like N-terminal domain-containing protein n=2 Tax=Candidatus Pantoea carbekii TaxID=1235990 RepID=U3U7Q8_9GAMM|nr:hypothetical protein HHS_03540 [Candidatus Pantoea carbekii]